MPEPTDRRKPLRVTIRTVAVIAGVSTANRFKRDEQYRQSGPRDQRKVEAAIQSAKWEPNLHARNLARTTEFGTDHS
jgi:DNA-binding LacI/PurR family transcriptional regulator